MDLETLIARVEDAGITVLWANLKTCNAGYDHQRAIIWLDHSLSSKPRHAVSILAHEWAHAIRGDRGPQPEHVEARCDVIAAGILINPSEYALAESMYGEDLSQIAIELGVTARIVQAYRGVLASIE